MRTGPPQFETSFLHDTSLQFKLSQNRCSYLGNVCSVIPNLACLTNHNAGLLGCPFLNSSRTEVVHLQHLTAQHPT